MKYPKARITFSGQNQTLSAIDGGSSKKALKALAKQASDNRAIAADHGDESSISFWEGVRCRAMTAIVKNASAKAGKQLHLRG